MKLPIPSLSTSEEMREFDLWVTASLGEVRDTDKFREIMDQTCTVMDILDLATGGFPDIESCRPQRIGEAISQNIHNDPDSVLFTLQALGGLLYLVTGKSDNNAKCQFPLYLRDVLRISKLPTQRKGKLGERSIPRSLELDKYMKWVADLKGFPTEQLAMLQIYLEFILSGPNSSEQLWALGNSYHVLKTVDKHIGLLAPLVVFQVRGSVSASGGHQPERLLREEMATWGLNAGIDFNLNDVGVSELLGIADGENSGKTRKFDFALPYQTPGWQPRILIQCQFYAGDSGSVSHKNVDQTPTGRRDATRRFNEAGFTEPVFIEFVDGAGYFASLNGDLRHLLEFVDTRSFTQLRSSPIRIRRELQNFGFLTGLEIDQAVLRAGLEIDEAVELLKSEGYAESEVLRLRHHFVSPLPQDRRIIARRYILLDLCAIHGSTLNNQELAGSIMIPGYGPFWGIKLDELSELVTQRIPILQEDWAVPSAFLSDIRWLCESGYTSLA